MSTESNSPNRRRLRRWPVAIPCNVFWNGQKAAAEISDLSFDGALLKAGQIPGEGADLSIKFHFKGRGIHLVGRMTSEVIHAQRDGGRHTFGVRFEAPLEEYWNQLLPVVQALMAEAPGGK